MFRPKLTASVILLALLGVVQRAAAEDAFYNVTPSELSLSGAFPAGDVQPAWRSTARTEAMRPYAVIDGEGDVYVNAQPFASGGLEATVQSIAIRAPAGKDIAGKLFVPKPDRSGMVAIDFKVAASSAKADSRTAFYQAKKAHYDQLLTRRLPGAAWFRHQARQAQLALDPKALQQPDPQFQQNRWQQADELSDTYALFSGGRAMSENLQLDRVLPPAGADQTPVDVASLRGITVQEIKWEPLIKDLKPKLDPLASLIPADQHAVFFPTMSAAIQLADETADQGMSVLQLAEPRSENARTFQRYEQQLCLPLTNAARLIGPALARSVALTGSDPYFRTGTDVAVIFEAPSPALLEKALLTQINLAARGKGDAQPVSGEVGGLSYTGFRSPDRRISCYLSKGDTAVIVANSLHQIEQFARVKSDQQKSLAALPEYTFFRNRYTLGDSSETAFVFLSDATIRRLCGPKWRIAMSRRTRDTAVMSEIQAAQLEALVGGKIKPGPVHTEFPLAGGELTLTTTGIVSSSAGSLDFMTPIAEMEIEKVTQSEAQAYERWRDGYQRNWSWAFDPIGLHVGSNKERLSADITVMPLIGNSEYRSFSLVSQGASIDPNAGDRHDALAHFILAINTKSPTVQGLGNFASAMMPQARIDPLGWLGQWVSLYVDDDPVWQELAKVPPDQLQQQGEKFLPRLPIAVQADVTSSLKLAAFLTAIRAFIEQTAPGMTKWESLTYKEQPYVKVTADDDEVDAEFRSVAIYYAASKEALILTLNEDVLKRALDRQATRRTAKAENKEPAVKGSAWLGSNLCLQVDRKMLDVLALASQEQYQAAMQARCWGNLQILNEWKRLFPEQDSIELHEKYWQTRLVCPGGGKYVWNDKWQTMESTVYGHPGEPKAGPAASPALAAFQGGNFGVTFEEQGLRARVELQRSGKQ